MADITMCDNKECSKKETCYRYTANRSDWQSFALFESNLNKDLYFECDMYSKYNTIDDELLKTIDDKNEKFFDNIKE